MLDACDVRDDEWGHQVRISVDGAVSDLHAADGNITKRVCYYSAALETSNIMVQ